MEKKKRGNSETCAVLLDSTTESRMDQGSIKKCLYVVSFAFMMNYAAYGGLIGLQSSMNIEEGLGTGGLVAIYGVSALSTIFFVPFLVDFMGAKTAIIAGELGIIVYTFANYYPRWYTIIPAAFVHGTTESASWAGAGVYITYLGEKFWENKKEPGSKKESHVYYFISVFYIFVYLSQVVGNSLVSVVLSSFKDFSLMANTTLPASGNSLTNYGNRTYGNQSWESCGAQDCQLDRDLNKYHPNQVAIYLLLSLFIVMQIVFTSVHAFAIPRIPAKFDASGVRAEVAGSNQDDENVECHDFVHRLPKESFKVGTAIKSELKATWRHMVSPLHLLVAPIIFSNGAFIAFSLAEFSRAYVSCTIGVEQVGWLAVIYGATSMLISLLSANLMPIFGRNVIFVVFFILNVTTLTMSLLWKPSPDTLWMLYLLAACLGSCDGTLTNALQGMLAMYFEDRLGIAFSVKNFAFNLGVVVGTGYSTMVCVYVKIYLLYGLLLLSTLCYIFAEIRFRRRKRSPERNLDATNSLDGN
ncbi:unnamed protein product [Clavelina lepadiformis]|uniref:Uncharacterized protein n=1 Tax=Clavelina lepadiformis TaxID=159417 RepID=A0ABP0FFE8_CLALP